MTAGSSGTPLPKKLGIGDGSRLAIVDPPRHWEMLDRPDGATLHSLRARRLDVIVVFCPSRQHLERRLPAVLRAMAVDGGLWVAWPKRASGVPTDMTEDVVREVCLPLGLVDNKVAAVDDVWSGLRMVVRRELRGEWEASR